MSHSEDRAAAMVAPPPMPTPSAQIIPFERPQSDLQRAVQQRAQEAMDRDRDRAPKPNPVRWLVVFALATIPVLLLLGAVDGFLRAYYRVNQMIGEQVNAQAEQASAAQQQQEEEPVSSEPGVIILRNIPDEKPTTPQ
jgi:hypothetical protein